MTCHAPEHPSRHQLPLRRPVRFGLQQVRKTPKTTPHQTVLHWRTEITGGRKELVFEDHHNNTTELVSLDRETQSLDVLSEGEIEVSDTHGIVGAHRGPAPLWLYQRITPRTEARDGVRALLKGLPAEGDLDRLHRLCAMIAEAVPYETGVSEPTWSAEETLKAGRGVCQDHAHVFIACARHLGLPARYVSGYLLMDGQIDQTAMHAWAEAWLDGSGLGRVRHLECHLARCALCPGGDRAGLFGRLAGVRHADRRAGRDARRADQGRGTVAAEQ